MATQEQGSPFVLEGIAVCSDTLAMLGPGFDDHHRLLILRRTERNQGTSIHARMGVDDRFDWLGKDGALGRSNAMAFATAEPEAVFGIEVTDISHTMPDFGMRIAGVGEDFVQSVLVGAGDIAMRHARAADHQFPDLPRSDAAGLIDRSDRLVGDLDDLPSDSIEATAHASAVSLARLLGSFLQNFARLDRGDRERLGRTVRSEDLAVRSDGGSKMFQDARRDRSAGAEDKFQALDAPRRRLAV